jgi:hypothetical protein
MSIDITKMNAQELIARALNHKGAASFLGMVALQLEGNGNVTPQGIAGALDRVAATLEFNPPPYAGVRERQPTVQPISQPLTPEEDDAALADHQLNTTMRGREIEAAADDRMAMIEF